MVAQAIVSVTGDLDMLVLGERGRVGIVTPRQFLRPAPAQRSDPPTLVCRDDASCDGGGSEIRVGPRPRPFSREDRGGVMGPARSQCQPGQSLGPQGEPESASEGVAWTSSRVRRHRRRQARLDLHIRPADELRGRPRRPQLAGLIERLVAVAPALVVLEATGGMEVRPAAALAAAGLPVAVVNPRQVRAFARAIGPAGQDRPRWTRR